MNAVGAFLLGMMVAWTAVWPCRGSPVSEGVVDPPPLKPEYPALVLLGSVTAQTEGFAIFLDQREQGIVRLRVGGYRGWILLSVRDREAILHKDRETVVFSLPAPGEGSGLP